MRQGWPRHDYCQKVQQLKDDAGSSTISMARAAWPLRNREPVKVRDLGVGHHSIRVPLGFH